jgi:hypothetical protein
MTPLDKTLKRVLKINSREYVVTLTPDALKITQKGHRLGVELKWADLVSGQSALAVALNASIGKFHDDAGKFQDAVRAAPRKPNGLTRRSATASARRATKRTSPKRPRRR